MTYVSHCKLYRCAILIAGTISASTTWPRLYNDVLTAVIEELIPAWNVAVRSRPSDPWFDRHCRRENHLLRRLEISAHDATKSTDVDEATSTHDQSVMQRNLWTVWESSSGVRQSSPRRVPRVHCGRRKQPAGRPPPCNDIDPWAFYEFFNDKVDAVRDLCANASLQHLMTPVTVDDDASAIRRLPNKYCVSDPIPSHLLVSIVDNIAPLLTALYNKSLQDGVIFARWRLLAIEYTKSFIFAAVARLASSRCALTCHRHWRLFSAITHLNLNLFGQNSDNRWWTTAGYHRITQK